MLTLRNVIAPALLLFSVMMIEGRLQAEQRGILKVSNRCSVAIDGGIVECSVNVENEEADPKQHPAGKSWDFWLQVSSKGVFLNPQNRAMFARPLNNDGGMDDCRGAMFKHDRFRIETEGGRVCVLTGQRKYGELTLESTGKSESEPLVFSYIVWE